MAGERNVLTADDPLVYFSSSGSTGREKHIPIT
ncbi:GH3 auxin-responsive promoter family protein, partial [Streptomyces canus]